MNQPLVSREHFVPSADLAEELLSRFGSPLYVYDSAALLRSMKHLENSLSYSRKKFAFACVTNGNLNILKIFKDSGWGLHANTPGDAFLGLSAGFRPADIVYSGSNLTEAEMRLMLSWGIKTFNLDSIDQLNCFGKIAQEERAADLKLGFRLNIPEVTGESRIGISPCELPQASAVARLYGLSVSGIHFYRGTSTNATERFVDAFKAVIDSAKYLEQWQYLDFGGGFGFPYQDRRHSFDWQVFGAELSRALSSQAFAPELIIEPGRSVIAGAACLLCTVVSKKWQQEKQFVGVDTTTANIAVLSVHGGIRQVKAYLQSKALFDTEICGNTTYSRDYIARNLLLPELKCGDKLAVLDTGAYGYAMSSHFLHRPRPAEVLIANGNYHLIRERENFQALLANQILPAQELAAIVHKSGGADS